MNLHSKHLKTLQTLFAKHPTIAQALLFGSRALGTHKESSDIDIALKGDITPTLLAHLKEELEDSTLPYFCDILDYERAPQELKEHIDTHALSLYKREEEWQEVRLGDVVEIKYGKDHKHLESGDIPTYGSGGIMRYVDSAIYDKESVLIPRKGTLNNIFYTKNPFWVVDTMFYTVIDTQKILPKFLYYTLKTFDFNLYNVGSAVPSLTTKILNDIQIPLPPLERQKEIAEILSSFDDKIDFLHRQNRTLESLAQTLFHHYFIENTKEEWEKKPFSELVAITSGKALPKGNFDENGQYEVLGANGCIGRSNEYNHDFKIIYTGRVGTLGKIFSINPAQKVWLSDNTLIIHPKEYFFYIFYLMQTFKLENLNAGSTQPLLRQGDLKNIQVKIPPKEILTIFEEYVNILQNKKSRNETKIFSLELFKKQVASFYL